MSTQKKKATPSKPAPVEPPEWLAPGDLMDFDDTALRAMARSVASGRKSERERALAAHAQVRAIPLAFPRQSRPATANAVLRRREGDAVDKATLFVALLRLCELPARLLFVAPPREALRGLPGDVCASPRPMVEVRIDGQWLCTDTFIFDERYIRAAHHRLQQKGRDTGYGVSLAGAIHWDGTRSVSVLGQEHLDRVTDDSPRYDDAIGFSRSLGLVQRLSHVGRWMIWTGRRAQLTRALRGLRSRQPLPGRRVPERPASVPARAR